MEATGKRYGVEERESLKVKQMKGKVGGDMREKGRGCKRERLFI